MITVTPLSRGTGLVMPEASELKRLCDIVLTAYPKHRAVDRREVPRAFWVAGQWFRQDEPDSHVYFVSWLDRANDLLNLKGHGAIEATSLIIAMLMHNDINVRHAAPAQPLEVGLNEWRGRPCNPIAWRELLTGERPLLAPVPPREIAHHGPSVVRSVSELG